MELLEKKVNVDGNKLPFYVWCMRWKLQSEAGDLTRGELKVKRSPVGSTREQPREDAGQTV